MREGYRTGRGRVVMRARTHFEEDKKSGRVSIIIDELPYQVNKANLLLKRIGELVREKRLEGISDIRDESDKSGMRARDRAEARRERRRSSSTTCGKRRSSRKPSA